MAEIQILKTSAAQTASGTGTLVVPAPRGDNTAVYLNISAVSGTSPSLTVFVDGTADGTNFAQVAAFTAQTAAGTVAVAFAFPAQAYRLRWTISGTTPSFTFSATMVGQVNQSAQ